MIGAVSVAILPRHTVVPALTLGATPKPVPAP